MIRPWLPLLARLGLGVLVSLALYGVCTLFGLFLPLPVLSSLGLAGGAIWWIIDVGVDRADRLDGPALDLDVDYALPHAQDTRVRRLEGLAYGAQPRRRMTHRGLLRTLGEIADERGRDPDAERCGAVAGPDARCGGTSVAVRPSCRKAAGLLGKSRRRPAESSSTTGAPSVSESRSITKSTGLRLSPSSVSIACTSARASSASFWVASTRWWTR